MEDGVGDQDSIETGYGNSGTAAINRRAAFSIVELMVSIGAIVILIGILLPSFRHARRASQQLGEEIRAKQLAESVVLYCASYRDMLPSYGRTLGDRSGGWGIPMDSAGLLSYSSEFLSNKDYYKFSYTGFVDPKDLAPGNVPPASRIIVRTQKITDVRFPSQKGMLWPVQVGKMTVDASQQPIWCCTDNPTRGAIPFFDTSVGVFKWIDFLDEDTLTTEYWAGRPVVSSWFGLNGIDRR